MDFYKSSIHFNFDFSFKFNGYQSKSNRASPFCNTDNNKRPFIKSYSSAESKTPTDAWRNTPAKTDQPDPENKAVTSSPRIREIDRHEYKSHRIDPEKSVSLSVISLTCLVYCYLCELSFTQSTDSTGAREYEKSFSLGTRLQRHPVTTR